MNPALHMARELVLFVSNARSSLDPTVEQVLEILRALPDGFWSFLAVAIPAAVFVRPLRRLEARVRKLECQLQGNER